VQRRDATAGESHGADRVVHAVERRLLLAREQPVHVATARVERRKQSQQRALVCGPAAEPALRALEPPEQHRRAPEVARLGHVSVQRFAVLGAKFELV
jgi:hypothetical protein